MCSTPVLAKTITLQTPDTLSFIFSQPGSNPLSHLLRPSSVMDEDPLPNRYLKAPIHTNGVLQIPFHLLRATDLPSRWQLTLSTKRPHSITLYHDDIQQGWQRQAYRDTPTHKDGAAFGVHFSATLDLSAPLTLYELQIRSRWTTPIHIELTPLQESRNRESKVMLHHGIFAGISLSIIMLILLLGSFMREPSHRLHALFLLTLLLSYGGYSPLFSPFGTWLSSTIQVENMVAVSSVLTIMASLWLWDHLLNLTQFAPQLHRLMRAVAFAMALLLPLILYLLQQSHAVWIDLLQGISMILYGFALGYALVHRGLPHHARYVLLSATPLFVALIQQHAIGWGLWPLNKPVLLTLAEGILLHLVLSLAHIMFQLMRINKEKINAEQQRIMVARNAKALVENAVNQRTRDLEQTIQHLHQANFQALQAMHTERQLQKEQIGFFSMLSQEFHTPLKRIQQAVEQIHQRASMDAKSHDRLFRIQENTARLGRLIDRFLSDNPLKYGVLTLQQQPVKLGQLIHNTLARMDFELYEKRLKQHIPNQELELLVDREMMEVALRNILLNALRYAPKSTQVTLSVLANLAEDHVTIQVQDQGPGIKPEEIAQLGEMFYRTRTTQHISGTGLGLFIVRRVVEAHGGSLSFHSEPGQGTQVRFQLPIQGSLNPKSWHVANNRQ